MAKNKKFQEFTVSTKESGVLRKIKFRIYNTHADFIAYLRKTYNPDIGDWAGGYYDAKDLRIFLTAEYLSLGIIVHECTHIAEYIRKLDKKQYDATWQDNYHKSSFKREKLAYLASDLVTKTINKLETKQIRVFSNYAENKYSYLPKDKKISLK